MEASFRSTHSKLFGKDYLYDLVQDPLWYKQFDKHVKVRALGVGAVGAALAGRSVAGAAREAQDRLYGMFEELLENDEVALGSPNAGLYEWDSERTAIDTFVIHHSNRANGISLPRLNAMELLRLYVPAYKEPSEDDVDKVKDSPIYSGHFRGGRQHFFPYHWLIRQDGTSERLLEDDEWGWQAGDLAVNRSSIAICFDDALTHKAPNEQMLAEAKRILHTEYGDFDLNEQSVVGHKDVSKLPTECPGDQFTSGVNWKARLIP